jgi:glycosyltransferase involved in cell wall biosynthesis
VIKNHTISVIVPVYNEERTVAGVLRSLSSFSSVDELICVDDGSSDDTFKEIIGFKDKAKIIHYAINKGKGYALYKGIKASKGEIVVFFDSDTKDLVESDIYLMVNTLLEGKYKTIIGVPDGNFNSGRWDSISGERVFFKSDILKEIENFKYSRLGVETYLNHVFPKWQTVNLKCWHIDKIEKLSPKDALASYIKEGIEIARERAKIEGFWSDEFEKQLRSLPKVKTWRALGKKVKDIPNGKLREVFQKYILGYAKKIKAFFEE